MTIIKEIKTSAFDNTKIKNGDAVYITDNKNSNRKRYNNGYEGLWLVNYVDYSLLKLVDPEGHICSFSPTDFTVNNPLDNVPDYEIEILASK